MPNAAHKYLHFYVNIYNILCKYLQMRCWNVNIVGAFIYEMTLSVRGHMNLLKGHVNSLRFVERTRELVERTCEFVGTCSSSHMLSKIQYDLHGEATTGPPAATFSTYNPWEANETDFPTPE